MLNLLRHRRISDLIIKVALPVSRVMLDDGVDQNVF
jgi:hypothetical protein